jgi:hypothetical protein
LQKAQEFSLPARTRIVCGKDVGGGAFVLRFLDGAFALEIEVAFRPDTSKDSSATLKVAFFKR